MKQSKLKAERMELHKIYVAHDIAAFRDFITKHSEEHKTLAQFAEASDATLSDLMHTMKSHQIYMGDEWQKSRNHLRYKQFWSENKPPIETVPLCITCKFFREPPAGEEVPCMHLGSTPGDIICPAFVPAVND